MIITTFTTLALRCPICGKMDFHSISRFGLSGKKRLAINCECGTILLSMFNGKNNHQQIQVECNMCEGTHTYSYPSKLLWSGEVFTFICDETGVEIGYLGSKEEVVKSVQNMDKTVQEMAEELGYGDYFINPEIMYKVLEHLYSIADYGKISCGCGNINLDVEVYPDRMELHCGHCGAVGIVFAESFKDWENAQRLDEVALIEGAFRYLDDKSITKKRKKKLKK